jgi:hypothetical protein
LAHVKGKSWKEELDVFLGLLNYRSTPHCTTEQPPALLLGRIIRNKILLLVKFFRVLQVRKVRKIYGAFEMKNTSRTDRKNCSRRQSEYEILEKSPSLHNEFLKNKES